MQHDTPAIVLIGILYFAITWLILYQVEIRLRIFGRIKCRFGRHKRTSVELGKTVKHFKCLNCGQPKTHHLKLIEGGKKDLGVKFRF